MVRRFFWGNMQMLPGAADTGFIHDSREKMPETGSMPPLRRGAVFCQEAAAAESDAISGVLCKKRGRKNILRE